MAEVNLNAAARNESMGKNEDNLLADGRYILTAKRNETYSCDFGGDCGLYAVCSAQDGADGEVAATVVIKALSKKREPLLQAEEAEKKVLFSDLLTQVNEEISQKGFQSKISICLLLASHGRASFYASGDCGLFLLRGKRFTCLHGLDEKKIFFGEHALLPLGSQQSFAIQQGDRFFLLGKGMIQALDIPMLHTIAARNEEPLQLVRDLVNEAMRREIGRSATAMVVSCTVREALPFLDAPVLPAPVSSGKRAQAETKSSREHRKVHITQSTKIIAFSVTAVLVACAGLVAMSSLIQRDKQARLAEKNAPDIPYAAPTLPEDNQYGAVILPSTTLPRATEKTTQAQRGTTRRRKATTRVQTSQTTTRKKAVSETAKPTIPPTQAPTAPPSTRPATTNPSPGESTTEPPHP